MLKAREAFRPRDTRHIVLRSLAAVLRQVVFRVRAYGLRSRVEVSAYLPERRHVVVERRAEARSIKVERGRRELPSVWVRIGSAYLTRGDSGSGCFARGSCVGV